MDHEIRHYEKIPFNSFEEVAEHLDKNINNLRFLNRSDILQIAQVENKFISLGLALIVIIGLLLTIGQSLETENYWILATSIIFLIVPIYARGVSIWLLIIALLGSFFISNIYIRVVCLNLLLAYILYDIWMKRARKLARKVLIENPEVFFDLWNKSRIAIAKGDEVYFRNNLIDGGQSIFRVQKDNNDESENIPTLKFCKNCGAPIINHAVFCNKCGFKFESCEVSLEEIIDEQAVEEELSRSYTEKKIVAVPIEDNFDSIRKWKQLYDEGILTEEEFLQKKHELLDL